MDKRRKHDFGPAKLDYITSTSTIAEIGKKHGIPLSTLQRWATRDGWAEMRVAETRKTVARAVDVAVEDKAQLLANWDRDDLALARAMRAQIALQLREATRPAIPGGAPRVIAEGRLRGLAITFEIVQRIGRTALGGRTAAESSLTSLFASALHDLELREEKGELIDVSATRVPIGPFTQQ